MTTSPRTQADLLSWQTIAMMAALIVAFLSPARAQYGAQPQYSDGTAQFLEAAPASWSQSAHGGHFGGYAEPYMPTPAYMPPNNYEQIPEDPFHDPDYPDPSFDFLKDVARNSWFRLEYIQWSFRNPSNELLGVAPSGVVHPEEPFLAGERSTGQVFVGEVASLEEIDQKNLPGIRGTLGIELNEGTLEWATFYIAKQDQTIGFSDFYNSPYTIDPSLSALAVDQSIFIPLLDQGVTPPPSGTTTSSSPVLAFDTSFQARLETSMFGTEANYVWNYSRPSAFWHWRPSVGIRYINFTEKLGMTGVTTVPDDHTTTIFSKSINNFIGPQAGLRAELRHEWFTLSVDPKVIIASNRQSSAVTTNDLYDSTTGAFETKDQTYEFSPMFSLAVQGQVHFTDNMSLFVGYDLLFIHRMSRPWDNIYYNDAGTGNPPGVVLDQHFTDFLLQGFSVGGQFVF